MSHPQTTPATAALISLLAHVAESEVVADLDPNYPNVWFAQTVTGEFVAEGDYASADEALSALAVLVLASKPPFPGADDLV